MPGSSGFNFETLGSLRRFGNRFVCVLSVCIIFFCCCLLCSEAVGQADQAKKFRDVAALDPKQTIDGRGVELPSETVLQSINLDPILISLVTKLDSSSYKEREDAMQAFLFAVGDKLQLYSLLAGRELSVEQRFRLLTAVREFLINTPRGALGIRMSDARPNGNQIVEVRVVDVIPGLPAERALQIGDRITHIDGIALTSSNDLIYRVQSKRPGESVELIVNRPQIDDEGKFVLDAENQITMDTLAIPIVLGSDDLLYVNSGRPRGKSPIEVEREKEVAAAVSMYSPQARKVAVTGELEEIFALKLPSVDNHPFIRKILTQKQWVKQGRAVDMSQVRDGWTRDLSKLIELSRESGLTPHERQYYKRVIDRYTEVMSDSD